MFWFFMLINFNTNLILHTTKQAFYSSNQQLLLHFFYIFYYFFTFFMFFKNKKKTYLYVFNFLIYGGSDEGRTRDLLRDRQAL